MNIKNIEEFKNLKEHYLKTSIAFGYTKKKYKKTIKLQKQLRQHHRAFHMSSFNVFQFLAVERAMGVKL